MRGRSPVSVGGQVSGGAAPIAYTPAITWPGNTITTIVAFYRRLPGLLFIWGSFDEVAGTSSSALTVPLPTGFSTIGPGLVGFSSVGGVVANNPLIVSTGATSAIAYLVTGVVGTHHFYMTVPVSG